MAANAQLMVVIFLFIVQYCIVTMEIYNTHGEAGMNV